MANTLTGLYETLVAAAADAARSLHLPTTLLDRVYYGQRPVAGHHFGRQINIQVPKKDLNNVTNIGSGAVQFKDTDHDNYPLTVDKHPSTGFIVYEWDQTLTARDLRELYLDARIAEICEYINNDVCSLVTTGNFNTYSSITGGADTFTVANLSTAWTNLRSRGVPTRDMGHFFFTTHTVPYAAMTTDTSFRSENIVGIKAAEAVQQTVEFLPQYGALLGDDPQFPLPSAGTYAALMHHRAAISLRAVLPPPKQAGSQIKRTLAYPKGPNLPIIIDAWEDGDVGGYKVHVHAMYGRAVTRPEFGSFLVST